MTPAGKTMTLEDMRAGCDQTDGPSVFTYPGPGNSRLMISKLGEVWRFDRPWGSIELAPTLAQAEFRLWQLFWSED